MTFEEVTADSRCPINALCVWAGSATVRVRIQGRGGEVRKFELQTPTPNTQSIQYRMVTLELLELQPYPFAGNPTDPSEYRATIRVSR